MGNLHLVTGYAGTPHVASSDQGSFHEAFIRSGQFVLDVGAKFSASIVTNNQIRVNDGEIMMQGRYVKLTPGAYVDLTIENGAQGYLRNDLVVARYTKNADTGIEECNLVVIKGTPAETNPSDPEYTTGIINANGALQNDLPLYRVSLSGLVLEGLTALFETEKSLYDSVLRLIGGTMAGNIAMSGHKVTGLGTPTANGDAVPLVYANENFAPSGYGLGSGAATILTSWNLATTNGWYRSKGDSPDGNYWFGRVETHSEGTLTQFANRVSGGKTYYARRSYDRELGTFSAWEWENPSLYQNTEYRTTERYQGAVVIKKVDSSGNILWRKDGETQWHLLSSASYVAAATVE